MDSQPAPAPPAPAPGPGRARAAWALATSSYRWTQWSSWPMSPLAWVLAAAVVVCEVGFLAAQWPGWWLWDFPVQYSIVPGLALCAVIGPSHLGLSRASLWAWREYLVAATVGLGAATAIFASTGAGLAQAVGLIVASASEEIPFRLVAPLVIMAVVVRALRITTPRARFVARLVALAASVVWFTVLPGHLAQMTSAISVLPFLATAAMFLMVLHRSGSILPPMITHAIMNLLTFSVTGGALTMAERSVGLGLALFALSGAWYLAGTRAGILVPALSRSQRRRAAAAPVVLDRSTPAAPLPLAA